MKTIAINEYKNDWPVAVVKIPDGKTAGQTFISWFKLFSNQSDYAKKHGWSDQKILQEALYVYSDLTVLVLEDSNS